MKTWLWPAVCLAVFAFLGSWPLWVNIVFVSLGLGVMLISVAFSNYPLSVLGAVFGIIAAVDVGKYF